MSSLILEMGYPTEIKEHPNADRMNIATWKGWQCCVELSMTTETQVVYFQPDLLLPHALAEELGVTPYLKKLGNSYEGRDSWAGRVGVARLRGVPSYGLLATARPDWLAHSDELAAYLGVGKYDPPEKISAGDSERDSAFFHRYTDIENIRNFPDSFEPGEKVYVTEKIHGTNCRLGYCPESDGSEWKWMAGSHGVRRRKSLPDSEKVSLYWQPFSWYHKIQEMINHIHEANDNASVVVFGEIYGSGVQDLQYGLRNVKDFRMFDISVNGNYLSYKTMFMLSGMYNIPVVPVLYEGPFDWEKMEQLAEEKSTVADDQISEGIVIRPEEERVDLQGRVVRKMIGFNYLNRKGGTEDH